MVKILADWGKNNHSPRDPPNLLGKTVFAISFAQKTHLVDSKL